MDAAEKKIQQIEEQLARIDARLEKARKYVARGVNVRGQALLHFDDWQGNSGHPSWMENVLIPAIKRGRARKEKALRDIKDKAKRLAVHKRRRSKVD